MCHIVLGLRPATPEEEGQIIRCVFCSKSLTGDSESPSNIFKRRIVTSLFQLILHVVHCLQRLVRKRKQIRPSARAQLVSYCNAMVAPVEGICQICKYNSNVYWIREFFICMNVFMKKEWKRIVLLSHCCHSELFTIISFNSHLSVLFQHSWLSKHVWSKNVLSQ